MGKGAALSKKPTMKKPPKSAGAGKVPKKAGTKKPASKTPKSAIKKPTTKKPKRSKKAASDDEGSDAEPEEPQPEVVADEEGDGEAVMRQVRDDPDEEPNTEDYRKKTDKQKADAAVKRANKKARQRGYRQVAEKGGYTAAHALSDQSRDVASNIITVNETRRAAGWRPMIEGKVAFENTAEYEERLAIANEPLPQRSGEVVRASLEVFMRRLVGDALQSAFDAGSKKLKPEHVMPHTRKLQRHLKYTFDAPKGVLRYAQQEKDGERLRIPAEDQEDIANADPEAVEEQKAMWTAQDLKNEKRKTDREERVAAAKAKKAARAA